VTIKGFYAHLRMLAEAQLFLDECYRLYQYLQAVEAI